MFWIFSMSQNYIQYRKLQKWPHQILGCKNVVPQMQIENALHQQHKQANETDTAMKYACKTEARGCTVHILWPHQIILFTATNRQPKSIIHIYYYKSFDMN